MTETEILPQQVAEIAAEAFRKAGAEVRLQPGGPGRYARMVINTQTGQTFTIQIEEVW